MEQSLLNPIKTTKRVRSNIDKFESLNVAEAQNKNGNSGGDDGDIRQKPKSKAIRNKEAIIQIVDDGSRDNSPEEIGDTESLGLERHQQQSLTNAIQDELKAKVTSTGNDRISEQSILQPQRVQKKVYLEPVNKSKRDSTAFLQRTYLLPKPAPSATPSSLTAAKTQSTSPRTTVKSETRETNPTSGQSLAEDAQEILKSQPNQEDLAAVFEYLQFGMENRHDFNVKMTSARSAQIIYVLVTTTVPDMWPNLSQSELSPSEYNVRKTLLACLASPAGIGALVAQIKIQSTSQVGLHQNHKHSQHYIPAASSTLSSSSQVRCVHLIELLRVLAEVLRNHRTILHLLLDTSELYAQESQRRMSWQEIVTLVAGGRILGAAAQALTLIGDLADAGQSGELGAEKISQREQILWLGDGSKYNKWLAKNLAFAATQLQAQSVSPQSLQFQKRPQTLLQQQQQQELLQPHKFLSLLLKRALSLGHRNELIEELYRSLLLGPKALWTPLHQLLTNLSSDHEQKMIFDIILSDMNRRCFYHYYSHTTGKKNTKTKTETHGKDSSSKGGEEEGEREEEEKDETSQRKSISAMAALIAGLVRHNEILEDHLEEWLVVANASYATIGLAARRALIATLATEEEKLERVLERALSNFADKLQIQHASSLQQDACAQTILLTIGYLKRLNAITAMTATTTATKTSVLKRPEITSLVMHSVSNRLAASVPHVRFLGMVVGMAMSSAVDSPDQRLKFDIEEMDDEEDVQLWQDIPDLQDAVADSMNFSSLSLPSPTPRPHAQKQGRKRHENTKVLSLASESKLISILDDTKEMDDEEEEDGLVAYAKPDSDPEDSDDDPTVINRAKPSAPVYIIDLIKQLQTSDKPDVIDLALRTAPSLIRRKTGFGSELSDNINALTTSLINLQDGVVGDPRLESLRLSAVIACILAKPASVAPSLAALYFEGDFAISQRVMLLTTLGLSARELAGFFDDENKTGQKGEEEEDMFPSKRLPPHLQPREPQKLEARRQDPISALTVAHAQTVIQPMALAAADKMTGPSILKIRTFSSRMEVEKRRAAKVEARMKMIPKDLHALLAKSFYLPLCSRMSLVLSVSPSVIGRLNTTILLPSLVRMLLQTLTLILHTLGPSASLNLPALTHETLLLLLALHAAPGLATDAVVLPALLHLLLALMDVTIETGYAAQERLIVEHGSQVAELVSWSNGLGEQISIPQMEREGSHKSNMPWTVLAAGIQLKWFEMGNRFQGKMLGLMDDN